jgi:hypothetical protein
MNAHFASNENLFASTLDRELKSMAASVPMEIDDFPGRVGRLLNFGTAAP